MARFANEVTADFNSKHINTVRAAAMRTGMYLTIDESDLSKMVPVKYASLNPLSYMIISFSRCRFSPDFGETLTSQHPLHGDVVEYKPVVIPPVEDPVPEVRIMVQNPIDISVSAQGMRSRVTSEVSGSASTLLIESSNSRIVGSTNSSLTIRIRGRTRAVLNEGFSLNILLIVLFLKFIIRFQCWRSRHGRRSQRRGGRPLSSRRGPE